MKKDREVVLSKPLLENYSRQLLEMARIDPELYNRYNVKRGLRNADGTGVLVGLTTIGSVHGYIIDENEKVNVPGELFYRGVSVADLIEGARADGRPGFEETAFLLLIGHLPSRSEMERFRDLLDMHRPLPSGFKESAILSSPSLDVMNKLSRSVLAAFSYDENPDDNTISNVLRQSIELIARFPTMAAYAYQAKAHYRLGEGLFLNHPVEGKSAAENFLIMTRRESQYTPLEAELLDLCLVLHAEHGGGNNSAFTAHVVTSSGTDTYSAIAAALLSLKGPRHGGANLRVRDMMEDIKRHVGHWEDEGEVADYLEKILDKQAFDRSGLIYGLGHAVYTLSDPRAVLLHEKAAQLAASRGRENELCLYEHIERLGPELFTRKRGVNKPLCANVDFYSGFVYDMLGIPPDLYTPLFAVSRVAGWCAHRMEELINGGRIIRPAYKAVGERRVAYVPMEERKDPA